MAELKFNCFFLLPLVDAFPPSLRRVLEGAYEAEPDAVFDVAALRAALTGRQAALEAELKQAGAADCKAIPTQPKSVRTLLVVLCCAVWCGMLHAFVVHMPVPSHPVMMPQPSVHASSMGHARMCGGGACPTRTASRQERPFTAALVHACMAVLAGQAPGQGVLPPPSLTWCSPALPCGLWPADGPRARQVQRDTHDAATRRRNEPRGGGELVGKLKRQAGRCGVSLHTRPIASHSTALHSCHS